MTVYDSPHKCSNKSITFFCSTDDLELFSAYARLDLLLVAELKSFYAVARCGSVTKAAGQLGVSQPTVTSQLRQLESRYGIELFHRQGRSLRLSDAGHRLMPQVERLMLQETEIEFRLRDASELREGTLRIGATGPYYIMDTVQRYHQRYPAIELSLSIGNSQGMLQALREYHIEIATSAYAVDDPQLYRRTIAVDPMRLVVHREHPLARHQRVSLQALESHTLLLREPGSMTRQLTEDTMTQVGVAPSRTLEIGSREAIRQAVLCQLGVSLIPASEVPPHPQLAALELSDCTVMMHEYLYCLRERQAVQPIERFLALAPDCRTPAA